MATEAPALYLASLPRRILSESSVRSYSATAPRICRRSWSLGSELIGLSTNSTRQPTFSNSSMRTIWWT